MASCVKNIRTKSYQNLIIGFQVTVENVGNVFLRDSVYTYMYLCRFRKTIIRTSAWRRSSVADHIKILL